MRSKKVGLAFVFMWFAIGGIGHFIAPEFFLKIVPPHLPLRLYAVYISGFFELAGALGLLQFKTRRVAGNGLFLLTLVVSPANIYMWRNPQLFPGIPGWLLAWRLVLQVALLACIWWATLPPPAGVSTQLKE